jgi:curved DNA-binding protein CbpA
LKPTMTHDDPRKVLGISPQAGDEEIRAAYLRKVKEYPPDRAPREFEKVRDAYEALRDPRRRTRHLLLSADPEQPLVSLLQGRDSERRFMGPDAWQAVLRETRS